MFPFQTCSVPPNVPAIPWQTGISRHNPVSYKNIFCPQNVIANGASNWFYTGISNRNIDTLWLK